MNQYTQLLTYIKTLGEADGLVNTITQGDFDRLDLDKGLIYPLLHITITGGNFTNGSTVILDVEIAALQQRDTSPEISTDKFWQQDNEVDNMNEMLAILNRIWTNMFHDFAENDITASETPSLDIIDQSTTTNNIEGWLLSFQAELPNTTINLCT